MDHPKAIVDHDVAPTLKCSCHKLTAAGWKVQCSVCGAGLRPAVSAPAPTASGPVQGAAA